jgi:hypothetical protein
MLSAHLTRAQDMGYRNIEQVALVSCKTKEGVPELRKFITELAKSKMKVPLLRIAVSKQGRERERERERAGVCVKRTFVLAYLFLSRCSYGPQAQLTEYIPNSYIACMEVLHELRAQNILMLDWNEYQQVRSSRTL